MAAGLELGMEVRGLAQALRTLAQVDPELRKATIKDMKAAARPLEAAARALVPDQPLTNWGQWEINRNGGKGPGRFNQAEAQRGIKTAFRGGKVRGKPDDHFPLLSLRQTNGPGAIVDMAGRANGRGRKSENKNRGRMMIRKLDMNGTASRTLWPAVEQNFGAVEGALKTAIETMSTKINNELKGRN